MARLAAWLMLVWLLLSWMVTPESLAIGAVASFAGALAFVRVSRTPGPWVFLQPRRLLAVTRFAGYLLGRVVVANVRLSRMVVTSGRPSASGMVIVPTRASSDSDLAAVGLLSSLVVDNQLVDLDRSRRELMYHVMEAPPADPDAAVAAINGPIEARIRKVHGNA